jgi:hypothetical protein
MTAAAGDALPQAGLSKDLSGIFATAFRRIWRSAEREALSAPPKPLSRRPHIVAWQHALTGIVHLRPAKPFLGCNTCESSGIGREDFHER